jgi:peptidoglycan/xylan/chitin deacetylase (PgdA/CDA1 family)
MPKREVAEVAFESEDFIVTFAKAGDSPERLSAKFLGDPAKAWMIEDYNGTTSFTPGQEVIIPRRPWNLSGVEPSGYQLVPVLVYHNIGPVAKGRLIIAVKTFEEQMRYLKAQGYRVVRLTELYEFISLRRQLPRKAVVLTFDDGYKAFSRYARPILKELGLTATLFVYTDYIGASQNALTWEDLRELAQEGFDVQAHSKTHNDLRRNPGEAEREYARRMQAELGYPLTFFERYLGRRSRILAYPYGGHDDEVERKVKEYDYVAAFDVLRQGNPSFVRPFAVHRNQIYSDMTLEDFAKNLNLFNGEAIR